MQVDVYTFECPLCKKLFRSQEPGEPCCTGPSEMRDDHDLTVMLLKATDKTEVHPLFARQRAAGPLIIPVKQ